MKKYDLPHILFEILGIAVLMLPVGLVLAVVSMITSTAGDHIAVHTSWATLCAIMGVVAVTLRVACGLDSSVIFTRWVTLTPIQLTRHEHIPLHEQRRYPRYGIELPATFYNHRTSGFVQLANISAEGCRIKSHVDLALHDCGQLLIEMPGSAGPVKVPRACVRWVRGNECGLEFIGTNLDEQGWLNRVADQKSRANH